MRLPCEFCGQLLSPDEFETHTVMCAITSAAVMTSPFMSPLVNTYEDNLRLQEEMGGDVRKACSDVDTAAPVVTAAPRLDRCGICLREADELRRARCPVRRAAACGHEFCGECLETWLAEHTTCPLCVCDLSVHGGHRFVVPPERPRPAASTSLLSPLAFGLTRPRSFPTGPRLPARPSLRRPILSPDLETSRGIRPDDLRHSLDEVRPRALARRPVLLGPDLETPFGVSRDDMRSTLDLIHHLTEIRSILQAASSNTQH